MLIEIAILYMGYKIMNRNKSPFFETNEDNYFHNVYTRFNYDIAGQIDSYNMIKLAIKNKDIKTYNNMIKYGPNYYKTYDVVTNFGIYGTEKYEENVMSWFFKDYDVINLRNYSVYKINGLTNKTDYIVYKYLTKSKLSKDLMIRLVYYL